MDPIHAIIIVIVVGLLVWLAITYIPMADPFPRIVVAVAVIVTVLWLLSGFGLFSLSGHLRTP